MQDSGINPEHFPQGTFVFSDYKIVRRPGAVEHHGVTILRADSLEDLTKTGQFGFGYQEEKGNHGLMIVD